MKKKIQGVTASLAAARQTGQDAAVMKVSR